MIKKVLTFTNEAKEGIPPSNKDYERLWWFLDSARDSKTFEAMMEIDEIKQDFQKHGDVTIGFNDVEVPGAITFKGCCPGGCKVTLTKKHLDRAIATVKSVIELGLSNAVSGELIRLVRRLEAAETVEE